ncbi:MAG: hypothetical protein LBP83_05475 [Dysgonamonadaceae bacterium]|nr:hypothetical protein [Dysgonamonadaceae bacterium]
MELGVLLSLMIFSSCLKTGITKGLKQPITVYNNWAACDELSDTIPQTEELAMHLLNEIIRLKLLVLQKRVKASILK